MKVTTIRLGDESEKQLNFLKNYFSNEVVKATNTDIIQHCIKFCYEELLNEDIDFKKFVYGETNEEETADEFIQRIINHSSHENEEKEYIEITIDDGGTINQSLLETVLEIMDVEENKK